MKFFSSIILLLIPFFLFSQGDTNLVNSLISKSDALSSENFQGAEKIAFQALEEALKTTDYICLAKANNNISELYKQKGNFSKSAHYLYLSGENYLKGGNDLKGFHSMNYAGYFYTVTGNFDKASEILLLVQKKAEQKQFKKALPMNYLAWGFLYRDMKKQEKAMEYFMKAHKIVKDSLGYYTVKFTSLNEIGNIYNGQKNYKYALKYQLQSLKIKEEIRDSVSIGYSFNDIGISYMLLGKLDSAKYYYGKTLQLAIETKNKHIESSANINFAELCKQEKKYKEGIEYANKGYVLAKEIQDAGMIQGSIQLLGYFYEKTGDKDQSISFLRQYIDFTDSLHRLESVKQTAELQERYESEKKEKEIEVLTLDKQYKEKEIRQQQIIKYTISGIAILLVFFFFFAFRAYKIKKKSAAILAEQKEEIIMKNEELQQQKEEILGQRDQLQVQSEIIFAKSKEVEDSIRYALKIQEAVLPSQSLLTDVFSDSFILYLPKDIVSGDFYYFFRKENLLYIAAADCTGHGVPGGFMSMLGITFLNEIIAHNPNFSAAEILDRLREEIIRSLKQTTQMSCLVSVFSNIRDGMDISFCIINTDTLEMQFAGANNPTWVVPSPHGAMPQSHGAMPQSHGAMPQSHGAMPQSHGAMPQSHGAMPQSHGAMPQSIMPLQEIKGDKQPIGIYYKMTSFTNQNIQIQKGDRIYLMSDGFADQFGGPKNKKIKKQTLKNFISSIQNKDMQTQKDELVKMFEEWRSVNEQVDDVLVIGFKV